MSHSRGTKVKNKMAKYPASPMAATGSKAFTSTHHPVKMHKGAGKKKSRKA